MSYYNRFFMLNSPTAVELYEKYAKDMPIFDYHCHLSEKEILDNAPMYDMWELWLKYDHYKWRLMRNAGIDERYITGDATPYEKFAHYCEAISSAYGNPLYNWSQVELEEYLGITLEINGNNAKAIWDKSIEILSDGHMTPRYLIETSNCKHIFTTNDALDDMSTFDKIASKGYAFDVMPSFRADKVLDVSSDEYATYMDKLSLATGVKIVDIPTLFTALNVRIDDFLSHGSRVADISVSEIYPICDIDEADGIMTRALSGNLANAEDLRRYQGYMTYALMKLYDTRGLAVELHIGAMRNNNTLMFERLGRDSGFDSIAPNGSIYSMSRLFDKLTLEGNMPRTIVFNLNPNANLEITTLLGNFQDSTARGKLQYGPAWWFLDHEEGILKQLKDLSSTGHLGSFIGMLTDSRSFLSYTRHHYFRRILCNYLGEMIDTGRITSNLESVGETIANISYNNAIKYFGI